MDADIRNSVRHTHAGWRALLLAALGWLSVTWLLASRLFADESRPAFPGSTTDWNGYVRHDFEIAGRKVLVIEPRTPLAGRPWVWHGEFFGHRPDPDITLLGRGFHIVYLSVPDLLGSPRAVQHWNDCYRELTSRYQLARKVALVGLSRGGLYSYNWAVANPESVACIYGDAPVCDFKSWPGGKGQGQGDAREWQRVLAEYGFADEAAALAYARNPVDNLEPLADAGVPLLHVYGDADEVVPWTENTGLIAERYQRLGGSITLIAKPGVGHHPHGLTDSTPIVEFIARHAPGTAREFVDAVWQPWWKSTRQRETVLFVQADAQSRPTARLRCRPVNVRRVRSATHQTEFAIDTDLALDAEHATLQLPSSSPIPFLSRAHLLPTPDQPIPQIARQDGVTTHGVYFDNGSAYHRLQVEIEYDSESPSWQGPTPQVATQALARTRLRLLTARPLRILLLGDSISAGYNASKFTQAPPYSAAYGELLALALEQATGSQITFRNYAVGGWSAAQGLELARQRRLGQQQPNLVIIAFGMNDVFARQASDFQTNVQSIIRTIAADAPDCEFIVVSSMLGNADWGMPMEQFALHRQAIEQLAGNSTACVDLTTVWEELLRHKSFYDTTGNGVNHPNDWGHLLYAQWIAATILGDQPWAKDEPRR